MQNHPPDLQQRVDEAKLLEWHTVTGRHAVRVVLGQEATHVRRYHQERIMGCRLVMTYMVEEDSPVRVKGRGPPVPTLSQMGQSMPFQLVASHKWELMLGEIKGAFLPASEIPSALRHPT